MPAFSTQPRVETAGTKAEASAPAPISLSVLNHESKRLERYSGLTSTTTGVAFSTQPRVETAGTVEVRLNGILEEHFQYSTTSRNGWNANEVQACGCRLKSFQYSTTSRNGWNGGLRQGYRRVVEYLSVLNHESKRLEPSTGSG